MCNLYSMTATVDELRRVFGPFAGDTENLPNFGDIYPNRSAPVLRAEGHAWRSMSCSGVFRAWRLLVGAQ